MRREMRTRLIYWEQNGQVLEAEVEWEALLAMLNAGTQCGTWIEGRTPHGYWECKLYVTPNGIYVLRNWVPEHGYSWSEVEVYRLEA